MRKRERLQGESSHSSLAIGSHHRPQQPQPALLRFVIGNIKG